MRASVDVFLEPNNGRLACLLISIFRLQEFHDEESGRSIYCKEPSLAQDNRGLGTRCTCSSRGNDRGQEV